MAKKNFAEGIDAVLGGERLSYKTKNESKSVRKSLEHCSNRPQCCCQDPCGHVGAGPGRPRRPRLFSNGFSYYANGFSYYAQSWLLGVAKRKRLRMAEADSGGAKLIVGCTSPTDRPARPRDPGFESGLADLPTLSPRLWPLGEKPMDYASE